MVEGYNKNISSTDSKSTPDRKTSELITWIRCLQQSLTVEVDHGFTNIQGRTNKFSCFVSGYLLSGPSVAIQECDFSKLKELAFDYENYSTMSKDDRRRLIAQTRQSLHNLCNFLEGEGRAEEKKLKIRRSKEYSLVHKRTSSSDLLSLGSSISAIKGVGPKKAERMSSLGLILIRDLINYFPRDYVDYTSLKTIDKSQPGQNVTIVAKVRRCSSFKSPKNPNLSILELFINSSIDRLGFLGLLNELHRLIFATIVTF